MGKENIKHRTWKSNQEDVDRMIRLYKMGTSMSEIGRMVDLDHTSVMYWIKKYIKDGGAKVVCTTVGRPLKKTLSRKKIIKKRGGDRYGDIRIPKDNCQYCGKKKEEFDPKWRLTNFCCLKHWDAKMMGTKDYLLQLTENHEHI